MTSEPADKSRRNFLKTALLATGGLALLAGGVWTWRSLRPRASVLLVREVKGPTHALGHRLRQPDFPPSTAREQVGILIVGGGITGLSAARWLRRMGREDFLLLEMEPETGGNSRSGRNAVTAFPLGAHYLPLPTPDNTSLLDLLQELGVITARQEAQPPTYREEYLCADPEERLLIHGQWQEGLVPQWGVPEADRRQISSFMESMRQLREELGTDGRPRFTFPLSSASSDPRNAALDSITMRAHMDAQGWTSEYLRWYVDYCCRDDYGEGIERVSAYAGCHYFAARGGTATNAKEGAVLTWPEGNAWLAQEMARPLQPHIRTGHMAIQARSVEGGAEVDVFIAAENRTVTYTAQHAILAMPQFVAARIVQGREPLLGFTYAPWVVANVTVGALPAGMGAPLSWDNVRYGGESLGYIVATHQRLSGFAGTETVLTWYQPLDHLPSREARSEALARTPEQWQERVLADLEKMHAGITASVTQVEVWVWGHGMVTPTPGFIWGELRHRAAQPLGSLHFAHTDLSGISVFEEAFDQGIRVAVEVLAGMPGPE